MLCRTVQICMPQHLEVCQRLQLLSAAGSPPGPRFTVNAQKTLAQPVAMPVPWNRESRLWVAAQSAHSRTTHACRQAHWSAQAACSPWPCQRPLCWDHPSPTSAYPVACCAVQICSIWSRERPEIVGAVQEPAAGAPLQAAVTQCGTCCAVRCWYQVISISLLLVCTGQQDIIWKVKLAKIVCLV